MKYINTFLIILCLAGFSNNIFAQDNPDKLPANENDSFFQITSNVNLPVNLYDNFTFNEKVSPYIRTITYLSGPAFMTIYGFMLWDWGSQEDFTLKPQTFKGAHAINGAADKWGHMFANYAGKRFFTFLFRSTGSSKPRSNIEGAILMEMTSLIGEVGDGYSHNYGFDPYDVLFNQFGIMLGMLLDWSPVLDRMFTMKWEYFPSKRVRNHLDKTDRWDISTDYNDAKYILATKLGGIPYLSQTPFRYFNIDVGYYTRGYRHTEEYPSRTRNIFLGFSVNFTIAFGDLLPVGYTSSTLQSLFNYYHPPWDLEAKTWVISDKPHEDFE